MFTAVKEHASVLIVDDNEIDTLIHRKLLERISQVKEIHTASNGQEAIRLLSEYHSEIKPLPNVILLDINMPIMDGFTFINEFRQMPILGKEKVTIVIVTSSNNPSDLQRAREVGIDHFVIKPLSEEKILATIGN